MPPATCKKTGERPTTVTKESNCVEYAVDQDLNPLFIVLHAKIDQWTVSVLTMYFFDTLAPFLRKLRTMREQYIYEAVLRNHGSIFLSSIDQYGIPFTAAEKEPIWICEYFVMSQNNKLRDVVADFPINSILSLLSL